MRVLVLGLGHILLRDEGVGVRVIEALAERYVIPAEVEIVDGGTSGMDLLDPIACPLYPSRCVSETGSC